MSKQFFTRFFPFLCVILILFSFTIAILSTNSQVIFGYDQARDAFEAYSIWHNHDLKILGPASDIPNLNHGVLWYYFLAIPYAIFSTIELVATYNVVLLFLTVPLCWYFSLLLFKNKTAAFFASVIYATSPLFIAFTHFLSNPILAVLSTPFLLFSLWTYLNSTTHSKISIHALLIGLGYGLLIQSNVAFVIMLFTIPLYLFFFKVKPIRNDIILFTLGFLTTMTSFILANIKFHHNAFVIITQYFLGSVQGSKQAASATLFSFLDTAVHFLAVNYLVLPPMLVLTLIFGFLIFYRKSLGEFSHKPYQFLFIWLSTFFLMFLFNKAGSPAEWLYGPLLMPCAVLIAALLVKKLPSISVLSVILLSIVFFQYFLSYSWMKESRSPLSLQTGVTTQFEKTIIDYTYQEAQGQPFVITTITNPFYINTTWAYLYEFYGKPKYGYVPYWDSRSQKGFLGNLPEDQTAILKIPTRYLIIEPTDILEPHWVAKIVWEEEKKSDIVENKNFHKFVVQKRILNLKKEPIAIPDILKDSKSILDF